MRLIILLLAALSASAHAAVVVSFDLSDEPGDQSSTEPSYLAPGISSSVLIRPPWLTPQPGPGFGSLSGSGWKTGELVTGNGAGTSGFFAFNLTPSTANPYEITSVTLTLLTPPGGPEYFAFFSGVNNYSAPISEIYTRASTLEPYTFTFTDPALTTGALGTFDFRLYGWGGSDPGTVISLLSTFTVEGAAIPEPSTCGLLLLAGGTLLVWRIRRSRSSLAWPNA